MPKFINGPIDGKYLEVEEDITTFIIHLLDSEKFPFPWNEYAPYFINLFSLDIFSHSSCTYIKKDDGNFYYEEQDILPFVQ